jgi:hypothetical protein
MYKSSLLKLDSSAGTDIEVCGSEQAGAFIVSRLLSKQFVCMVLINRFLR